MAHDQLPTDLEVLDAARSKLSAARDWLNSDTADAIAGRRSSETGEEIVAALVAIGNAKAAIDAAKGAIYRAVRS